MNEISTIFYFAPTLSEYTTKWDNGDISPRTIVFVAETGEIYKNNKLYGKMSTEEIINIINQNVQNLPVATQQTLGAIMVGDKLSITSAGKLSVDVQSLLNDPTVQQLLNTIINNYITNNEVTNIPVASSSELGGIKIGYTENNKNYAVKLDGNNKAYVTIPWDTQVGPQGVRGDFVSRVFARSIATPATPTGGTYESPIPTSPANTWYDGIPDGTGSIWTSICTFYGAGGSSGWSAPTREIDTMWIDIEFSPNTTKPNDPYGNNPNLNNSTEYRTNRAAQGWYDPATSTLPNGVNWSDMVWRAERRIENYQYVGDWVITKIVGEKGDKGDPGDPATYDDTELLRQLGLLDAALDSANDLAASERQRLTDLINGLNTRIRTEMETAFADAAWWQAHYPAGQTGSSSNFGQSDVEAYLQQIGVWSRNDDVTKTQWSTLSQNVSSITARVQTLEGQVSTGGNVNYSLLSSSLYAYINDNYSTAGMSSTWAKFMELSSGELQTLKWMSSGVQTYANDAQTYAELMAAAADYDTNGAQLKSAAADIRALVERDGNDNLVAKSSMTSMVDSAITGIINTATSSNAGTTIFSKINENSDDIAAIVTNITGDSSSATIGTKIGTWKAGLVTSSTLDSAVSALLASNATSDTKTGVLAQVTDKVAQLDLVAENDLTSAYIIQKVNGNTSDTTIKADKINIEGVLDAGTANITSLTNEILSGGRATFKGSVQAENFTAGDLQGLNIKTEANKISFNDGNTAKAWFQFEGSGMQLHMIGPDGTEYVLDFTKLNTVSGGSSYPANAMSLYKLKSSTDADPSVIDDQTMIYYNQLVECYTDNLGTTLATDSNMTGWYRAEDINVVQGEASNNSATHAIVGCKLYIPVQFDSSGSMTDATGDRYIVGPASTSGSMHRFEGQGYYLHTSEASGTYVPSTKIYDFTSPSVTGSLVLSDSNYTHNVSYEIYSVDIARGQWANPRAKVAANHYSTFNVNNGAIVCASV